MKRKGLKICVSMRLMRSALPQTVHIAQPNFSSIIEHCNLWRNYDDIQDSWASLEAIIDYYGNNQDQIVPNAGPGHWNDPDMVSVRCGLDSI